MLDIGGLLIGIFSAVIAAVVTMLWMRTKSGERELQLKSEMARLEERGQQISDGPLMDRREDFGPLASSEGSGPEVPAGVVWLVCSVDTQDDRLEAQVTGFGLGEECWVIDHQIWYGDSSVHSGESPEGVWAGTVWP